MRQRLPFRSHIVVKYCSPDRHTPRRKPRSWQRWPAVAANDKTRASAHHDRCAPALVFDYFRQEVYLLVGAPVWVPRVRHQRGNADDLVKAQYIEIPSTS